MAEYKGIKGFQVQTRTEDPSPTEAQTGDFYYNSSTGQFKTVNTGGAPVGTWASISAMPGGGTYDAGSFGTSTDNVTAGGYESSTLATSWKWNGTSWSSPVGNLNTARYGQGGSGSTTAGLIFGGYYSGAIANTESYNGSAFSEVNDMNTARYTVRGLGASGSAIYATGGQPYTNKVESWDGTSWTETTDFNTSRGNHGAQGSTTAGIIFGGQTPSVTANTETWDGSSWTEVNNLNTARRLAGSGTSTLALGYGGYETPGSAHSVKTEAWDGTSWTEVADLATRKYGTSNTPLGTANAALAAGGQPPGTDQSISEEWTANDFEIKTVTTS
tara:strand:+ start:33 stop:1022 length:990 start_codon:yes stop_codon:yes gene_type:complete